MRERGYTIGNIDCTLIAQKPKLSPHKEDIRCASNHLAPLLDCVPVPTVPIRHFHCMDCGPWCSARAVSNLTILQRIAIRSGWGENGRQVDVYDWPWKWASSGSGIDRRLIHLPRMQGQFM